MRRRGLKIFDNLRKEKREKRKRDKQARSSDPDNDLDEKKVSEAERARWKSPIPYVFEHAVYDEAHYMKNSTTMTTHAIRELKVRSYAFLTGTPMINRILRS